nr:MAG TPA: hypothetical protein [Caudoviricetes sp.]
MITHNKKGRMVIVDTEGRFPNAESIKGLLYDLIDCMQVCAEEGMALPNLHHFLTLLLPTERQVRGMVRATPRGVDCGELPENPNESFCGLHLDIDSPISRFERYRKRSRAIDEMCEAGLLEDDLADDDFDGTDNA